MDASDLAKLSLCTYSSGTTMVREVLEDWLDFLGGKPSRVIFAVSPGEEVPEIYRTLLAEGKIDEIHPIESGSRSALEIEPQAVRVAVESAATEWVMLVKLDTLPYRRGHADWFDRCMTEVRHRRLFGMTGSFRPDDSRPMAPGFSSTQKYTNNFSIIRREDWLQIVPDEICNAHEIVVGGVRFVGQDLRFATEAAIESHLLVSGDRMLTRNEDRNWSVFHVNVWGEDLRRVRARYRERKGIGPFLDTGRPPKRPLLHPWQWWYGTPPPPAWKRARIWLGKTWRRVMEMLHRPAR